MVTIPATHTIFSLDALLDLAVEAYDIGSGEECKLLRNGLNDTYSIEASSGKYVLRIYKAHWRTEEAIRYELELLNHLQRCLVPVSYPVARWDGSFLVKIEAPEGLRIAVLFTYAEGEGAHTEEHASLYGREVAAMHREMDTFRSERRRFALDLEHLLAQPMKSIGRAMNHRTEDFNDLQTLCGKLREHIEPIAAKLEWGTCHGDLHGGNVYYKDTNALTHFDFDCAGSGWRAYDLAVFWWGKVRGSKPEEFSNPKWDAFLKGYLEQRPVSSVDLQAIPVFVAIREIWLMGLHTSNSHIGGSLWLNDRYSDKNIRFIRDWMETHQL